MEWRKNEKGKKGKKIRIKEERIKVITAKKWRKMNTRGKEEPNRKNEKRKKKEERRKKKEWRRKEEN